MLINEFPFKAVLWDMDGTLVDSEPIWIGEERRIMESLGASWSDEDALYCIGGPMARVDAYMLSKLPESKRGEFGEYALTKMLLESMVERFKQSVPFAPGARNLIEQMNEAGIPMALVTASSRAIMEGALASIGKHFFKTTVSDSDVERSKPDPQGYQ